MAKKVKDPTTLKAVAKAPSNKEQMQSKIQNYTAFKKNYNEAGNYVGDIMKWILAFLITIALIKILQGGEIPTFRSFMEMITEVPDVTNTTNIFTNLTITKSWYPFNWLRDFINIFAGALSVLVYLTLGMVQLVLFAIYIIKWIFI